MIYIFMMSAETATASTESSGRVIRTIAKIVVDDFDSKPISYQVQFISSLQHIVRKVAHFVIYASLGFSVCGCALTFEHKKPFIKSLIAFLISFLYAVSDEIHQTFVSGRSGQLSDVVLDSFGIVFGVLLINLLCFFALKIIKRLSVRRVQCEQ